MSSIKHNGKKCSKCDNLLFARGFCKYHYNTEYLMKKKKPISGVTKKEIKNDYGFKSQIELFQYKWENAKDSNGNVLCELSGIILNNFNGKSTFLNIFSHILSKALNKYPNFKLNPDNIILVHPAIHYLLDFGTEEQRNVMKNVNWKIFYDRKEKLIEEYKKMK